LAFPISMSTERRRCFSHPLRNYATARRHASLPARDGHRPTTAHWPDRTVSPVERAPPVNALCVQMEHDPSVPGRCGCRFGCCVVPGRTLLQRDHNMVSILFLPFISKSVAMGGKRRQHSYA
jgi:hypothetical protein